MYLQSLEKVVIVDAANDCYATWKVFQMLEAFRLVEGVEMPPLIDYGEDVAKMNQKKRRQLLETMRCLSTEGGRSYATLTHLINITRTRMEMQVKKQSED